MRFLSLLFVVALSTIACEKPELDEQFIELESGEVVKAELPAGADFSTVTKSSSTTGKGRVSTGKSTTSDDQTIIDITVVQEPDVLEVHNGVTYFESLIIEEVTIDGVNGYNIVGSMIYHTNEFGEFVATINYMDGTQEFIEPADNVEVEITTQG